jgi:hypothetical protein
VRTACCSFLNVCHRLRDADGGRSSAGKTPLRDVAAVGLEPDDAAAEGLAERDPPADGCREHGGASVIFLIFCSLARKG